MNLTNEEKENIFLAVEKNDFDVITYLSRYTDFNFLSANDLEFPMVFVKSNIMCKLLISYGADINFVNKYNESAIFCVYETNELKILLQNGADPNLLNIDKQPLLQLTNRPDAILLLISYGADIRYILNNRKFCDKYRELGETRFKIWLSMQ